MEYSVPFATIVVLVIDIVASLGLVVGSYLFLRKRYQSLALPFFVGAGVFLLFAMILESIVHQVVLTKTTIAYSVVPFAIYAAAMAAIFEEGGRYLAFRTILKNRTPRKEEALMAGAGHGGMEVLLVFTAGMVMNLYYALVLYQGGGPSLLATMANEVPSPAETIFSALTYTAPLTFLVGLFERMVALVLHLSFALFVWLSVEQKRKVYLWISLGIHFVVDFVAVLLSRSGVSILLIELLVALMAAGAFYWALRESKRWEAVENKEATADLLLID